MFTTDASFCRSFVQPKVLAALERRDESSGNESSSNEADSDTEKVKSFVTHMFFWFFVTFRENLFEILLF